MQRRVENDGVDGRVHRIEDPAEPRNEEDQPLIACDALSPRLGASSGKMKSRDAKLTRWTRQTLTTNRHRAAPG